MWVRFKIELGHPVVKFHSPYKFYNIKRVETGEINLPVCLAHEFLRSIRPRVASCELSSVSREFASVFNRSVLIFHVFSCRRCVIPSFIPGVNGDISLPHSSQNSLHFGRGQLNFTLGASAVVDGWIRLYHMLGRSTIKFHRTVLRKSCWAEFQICFTCGAKRYAGQ